MDNREAEKENASRHANAHPRLHRSSRPRDAYNNWATGITRAPTTGSSQNPNNGEELPNDLSDGPNNNRESNLEPGRNFHTRPLNLPTIVNNDLSGTRRSNEPSNNARDNRAASRSNLGNNNNSSSGAHASAGSAAGGSSSTDRDASPSRGLNHPRPRRRTSNAARGASRSEVSTTHPRNPTNSMSPRRINIPRQRVPPLRLRGPRGGDPSDSDVSPDSQDFYFPSPYNRLTGVGTEEDPFMLPAGNEPQEDSLLELSDEEIARQLQQEEWERSSTPGEFSLFAPSSLRHNMFRRQPRRNLPAVRRRGEFSYPPNNGGRNGRSNRADNNQQAEDTSDGADLFSMLPPNLSRQPFLDETVELLPVLFDMFRANGMTDTDLANILNPSPDLDYEALLALSEEIGDVGRGLSQSDINKLPTLKHRGGGKAAEESWGTGGACGGVELPQCNICLTEYEEGDSKRLLPCKHQFHRDCVDKWLKSNATCPVCRSDVKMKKS